MSPIETVGGIFAFLFLAAYGLFMLYTVYDVLTWPPDDPRWTEYGDVIAGPDDHFDDHRFP